MIYLLFITLFMPLTASGFVEALRDRLFLGSAMLAEIKQECGKSEREQNYDALRDKLKTESVPLYITIADKLFSQSKEAQTATLWRQTAAALNNFLYAEMPFGALGSYAMWDAEDVQARLKALYAQNDVIAFNVSMTLLRVTYQQLDAKTKESHTWWHPVQNYRVFKNAHIELAVIIQHILAELLNLRLLIQRIAPDFAASPFKYLVPAIATATEQLQKKYDTLKHLDASPWERWYRDKRTDMLNAAILRCTSPMIPMGKAGH
jgi:hypothetical protein